MQSQTSSADKLSTTTSFMRFVLLQQIILRRAAFLTLALKEGGRKGEKSPRGIGSDMAVIRDHEISTDVRVRMLASWAAVWVATPPTFSTMHSSQGIQ